MDLSKNESLLYYKHERTRQYQRQTDRQRQTDKEKKTDRQTDKETKKERRRERERDKRSTMYNVSGFSLTTTPLTALTSRSTSRCRKLPSHIAAKDDNSTTVQGTMPTSPRAAATDRWMDQTL